MYEILVQPWPWWFSGIMIAFIMFLLIYFGQSFGFSSNLRTICAMAGAGKVSSFFKFDWKAQMWNIMFMLGAIAGGSITRHFLSDGAPVKISQKTIEALQHYGFAAPQSVQPTELFSLESAFSLKGFLILAIGGFLVGFGARYAGGCTSGHAISGLSNLQVPSLLAVVGFFIGGLLMTHFLFPLIF
ncbi:MAG: YeeE/YedE thiosulfate transporter family protein [Chitinophagales bacterium]|nr:YeeE/YedE family protein [Chitinophagales bacterium]MDW8272972.1 YeeE/YedE thiosulfate transporter family protein [Chitinophagales bacterium]